MKQLWKFAVVVSVGALWACGGPAPVSPAAKAGAAADAQGDAAPAADAQVADAAGQDQTATGGDGTDALARTDAPSAADAAQPSTCADGLQPAAWSAGPYGYHRHELADDFSVETLDGQTWKLSEHFSGCDVYAFVPDALPISDSDKNSVWTKDVAALLKKSPKNVHWFFFSRAMSDSTAQASLEAMQQRISDALGNMSEADGTWWVQRTHVIATRAAKLDGWLGKAAQTHGKIGFGIDRAQKIAGFGMLADIDRYKAALQSAGKWPWESNLAYAAHEPMNWNGEAKAKAAWDAQAGKTYPLWKGETLAQFAETDVTLTTAEDLAQYDTLEVEVEMRCPNPEEIEPGNCGAWDYLAHLSVKEADGKWTELARFITSYHRETHWRFDATPMLAVLKNGGTRHIRWEYAPEWNTQPTATFLSLKFSQQKKGLRPVDTKLLWTGGGFNSKFNTLHPDQSVAIPATAKKVQLWALITGHGAAAGTQCAEFCNHEHVFSVGTKTWIKSHPESSNQKGCMLNIGQGLVPNQGGTWWFGRGGWCPGMQVNPFVADLTAELPAGKTGTIQYKGLFKGGEPPDGDANIDGSVYLVIYQ